MLTEKLRKGYGGILDLVVKLMGLNTSNPLSVNPWGLFSIAQYDVPGFSPVTWKSCFVPTLKFVIPVVKLPVIDFDEFALASFFRTQVELDIRESSNLFESSKSFGNTTMP